MPLDLAILGFLAQMPRTGYDLKKRCFSGPIASFWTADQAQIYRTLERLKADGLVSVKVRRQSGRPDRRTFEITPAGRQALIGHLAEAAPAAPLRDPFLVQLFFSAALDDQTLLEILRVRREDCDRRLAEVRQGSARLAEEESTGSRAAVLKQTALDGAAVHYIALADWLDQCIDAVRSGALAEATGQDREHHLFGT